MNQENIKKINQLDREIREDEDKIRNLERQLQEIDRQISIMESNLRFLENEKMQIENDCVSTNSKLLSVSATDSLQYGRELKSLGALVGHKNRQINKEKNELTKGKQKKEFSWKTNKWYETKIKNKYI
ncbi:hypothetical protein [Spiroplasma ixodetis]|uniref:hypothetical protein n=1 Tax=Spiroplasma ixodetis TaxID=2141 RepID=UPI002577D304|nr:hypothetical protein [Spiroplasma ixodetis]WJG70101.1 hypothetical protein SIXOD_v1c11480 [Spiroplasma ixodetis Y32]